MADHITGLHHVTAITSDAQRNIDFYAGILGLRLVKRTVNFDAPDVYHLYFGNEKGDPGTILTFFPFPGIPRGKQGIGQVTVTSFSVPEDSFDYWTKRFSQFDVPFSKPQERFNEGYLYFEDFDGLGLELVADPHDKREPFTYGNIPDRFSIRGFHSVKLTEAGTDRTIKLLTEQMNYRLTGNSGNYFRFSCGGHSNGYVDLISAPGASHGRQGSGTIHHVAFATPDDSTQLEFRERLLSGGLVSPTPVTDRQYFHSVYFREPGGVLFEAATCDIGFLLDETPEHLGESLRLPPWEEKNRKEIEKSLSRISLDTSKFRDYEYAPDRNKR